VINTMEGSARPQRRIADTKSIDLVDKRRYRTRRTDSGDSESAVAVK
jgi:hypothetical protein